jgi:MFS family permease
VAAFLYFSGALITGYAPDLVILIIGRLIYGTGIGLVSTTPIVSVASYRHRLMPYFPVKAITAAIACLCF